MHKEASAMIVERRDEVFIFERGGVVVVVVVVGYLGVGSLVGIVVSWNRWWAALEDRWLVGLCDDE